MYSGKAKKTAKGVKESVKDRDIKHRDFKDCLFSPSTTLHDGFQIRSLLRDSFPVSKTLGPGPLFFFALFDLFLIPGIITFPIFV